MKAIKQQVQMSGGEGSFSKAFLAVRVFLRFLFLIPASAVVVALGPAAFRTAADASCALLQLSLEVCRISLFVFQVVVD
jgi:hypothetical protein